jgi:putative component of membrane protein insertase Oxa1/YidC/SpoIIIJ protein YidD
LAQIFQSIIISITITITITITVIIIISSSSSIAITRPLADTMSKFKCSECTNKPSCSKYVPPALTFELFLGINNVAATGRVPPIRAQPSSQHHPPHRVCHPVVSRIHMLEPHHRCAPNPCNVSTVRPPPARATRVIHTLQRHRACPGRSFRPSQQLHKSDCDQSVECNQQTSGYGGNRCGCADSRWHFHEVFSSILCC